MMKVLKAPAKKMSSVQEQLWNFKKKEKLWERIKWKCDKNGSTDKKYLWRTDQ